MGAVLIILGLIGLGVVFIIDKDEKSEKTNKQLQKEVMLLEAALGEVKYYAESFTEQNDNFVFGPVAEDIVNRTEHSLGRLLPEFIGGSNGKG
jgi:hypothetical protein